MRIEEFNIDPYIFPFFMDNKQVHAPLLKQAKVRKSQVDKYLFMV